jgi:hypothetical protein
VQREEETVERKEEEVSEEQVIESQSYVAETIVKTTTTTTAVHSSTTTTTTSEEEETVTFEELAADATGDEVNEQLVADEQKTSEDEISVVSSAFAEQLANVQTQLMALSHLPKTIQSTLDEITKQLQTLIPPSKLKQKSIEPEAKTEEETAVTAEGKKKTARKCFFLFN